MSAVSQSPSAQAAIPPPSAGPAPAPAPAPASEAGELNVVGSRFFAEDTRTNPATLTETLVIPFVPDAICFRWAIFVRAEQRTVALREEFYLPMPPVQWGHDPQQTVLSDNGAHATTRLQLSAADGVLTNSWCLSEGDPVGRHRIRVFFGERLLREFEFEVRR